MKNLKKVAITSAIVLLCLIGGIIVSFAQNTGIVTKEAKLRKTASDDSIILEIIPNKEEVEILEVDGDWYKVNYNKIKGYVRKDFIEAEENSTATNTVQENNQVTNETEQEVSTIKLQKGDIAITKNETSVYVRPLINSIVISNIEKDKKVSIMAIMNNWAYINTDTINGWVILDSLANNEDKTAQEQTTNKEEETSSTELNKTAYISATGINFRKEPNTDSEILKVFVENTQITILSEEGEWYKIKYKEQEGYVIKTYVSDKKVQTTSRSSVTRTSTTTNTTQEAKSTEQEETKTTTSTNNASTATASSKGQEVANYAKQFVGCKYVYGGSTPSKGFDCSGLTMYVYNKFGVSLSHSATAQSKVGTTVSKANLQPGDLVFFTNYVTNKGIGHVGIYIGNNKFVHASTEKTGVIISTLSGSYSSRFVTATRLINN